MEQHHVTETVEIKNSNHFHALPVWVADGRENGQADNYLDLLNADEDAEPLHVVRLGLRLPKVG